MADHWKTLANRLGTPGIDEPEVEEIKEEKSAPEAPSSASAARSADFESKPAAKKPAFEKALGGPPPVESPALAPEPVEEPVKPAKRKSSWETLASLFNVSIDRAEPKPEPVPEPVVEARPVQPVSPPPKRDLAIFEEPKADPNDALDAMFGDAPREKLRAEGSGWGKPKRVVDDLGWDDGDDFVRDSKAGKEELETVSELTPEMADEVDVAGDDEPARRRRRRRRGRRGRGRDEEASGKIEDGDRRESDVADDDEDASSDAPVSWKHDLIDVESAGPWAEPESFESDSYEAAEEVVADSDEDDDDGDVEVVRRSNRRRRRRGRSREDGAPVEGTPRDLGPREITSRESSSRDTTSRTEAPRRESAPRREPRGDRRDNVRETPREAVRSDTPRREPSRSDSTPRGREGGAHRDAPRNVEASLERGRRGAGRPVENILPRDDFDLEFVEPVDDELEDSDDEVRPTRSASGRRRRGGRKPVDSPARSLPEDEDAVEDEIDELSDDDEEGSSAGPKHRNIPTWSDSLESIIQANTENHKRNEGRGGPRGGGRSRGRR